MHHVFVDFYTQSNSIKITYICACLSDCIVRRWSCTGNNSYRNRAFYNLGCYCWLNPLSPSQSVTQKYISGTCCFFSLVLLTVISRKLAKCLLTYFPHYSFIQTSIFFCSIVCYGKTGNGEYCLQSGKWDLMALIGLW